MPLSTPNTEVLNALTAMQTILPANTALAANNGVVLINDDAQLVEGNGPFPAVVIFETGPQSSKKVGVRLFKTTTGITVVYLDRADQQTLTFAQVWANIDKDLHRIMDNLKANPTLTTGGTRYAERTDVLEPDSVLEALRDESTYGVPTVKREFKITLSTWPYVYAM